MMLKSTGALVVYATSVAAHFNFARLYVNGDMTGQYEYTRKPNNNDTHDPFFDVTSNDFRCNIDAGSGANTKTYTVKAGDTLGFGILDTFGHPGPFQVYMSKAPGLASEYDGSGDWFRIYSATTVEESVETPPLTWADHNVHSILFNLTEQIPDGEYLVRAEGIALHEGQKLGKAQFYIGCAQIKVTGGGNGTPGPLVKIPGVYTPTTPGVLIPDRYTAILNYTAPGPALWPEGTVETRQVEVMPGWDESED